VVCLHQHQLIEKSKRNIVENKLKNKVSSLEDFAIEIIVEREI
jgi:hypothetical protein